MIKFPQKHDTVFRMGIMIVWDLILVWHTHWSIVQHYNDVTTWFTPLADYYGVDRLFGIISLWQTPKSVATQLQFIINELGVVLHLFLLLYIPRVIWWF